MFKKRVHYLATLVLALLVICGLATPVIAAPSGTIIDNGGLADLALIPRHSTNAEAALGVRGTAVGARWVQLTVSAPNASDRIFRSEVGANGHWHVSARLKVELVDHEVEIVAIAADGGRTQLASYTRVVAGDVYLVQGQSNVTRGTASVVSPFARTYGARAQRHRPGLPDVV